MSEVVLDASAILALLNDEKGADVVQSSLPDAVISTVNLAEVVTRLNLIGMDAAEIREVVSLLGLEVIPFDEETAIKCGLMAEATHPLGLSLGDRACLSLAALLKKPVLTADRAWEQVSLPVEIRMIR